MAAENVVKYMSEADDNWFVQNSRFIAERDKNTQIHNAEKRGLEAGLKQGIQQGEQQKAIENARKLLADGKYTAEEISELFQIPVEAFTDKVKA